MESWSCSSDNITVGARLGDLDGLLLLEDQETVKLCSRLLPVVVPAQIKKAYRVCAGLSHDTLWEENKVSYQVLLSSMTVIKCLVLLGRASCKVFKVPEGRVASAGFSCSISSPLDLDLQLDLPLPVKTKSIVQVQEHK